MNSATEQFVTVRIGDDPRNMLNPERMRRLTEELIAANNDSRATGIILAGSNESFCEGLDLASIRSGESPQHFAHELARLLKVFPTLEKPIAAAVCGDAIASGAALVAACDYAVASTEVKIGSHEVGLGVWPVIAQVPLVKRIGARNAIETVGSGEPFTARRAANVGLVNEVVPANQVRDRVESWLAAAARGHGVYSNRRFFYSVEDLPYDVALDAAAAKFDSLFQKV